MWIVCQIGAREHYAIPRALHGTGELAALLTDFWVEPESLLGKIPGGRRLKDRYHPELAEAQVHAPNLRMLGFECEQRLRKKGGWPVMLERNRLFQRMAIAKLSSLTSAPCFLSPSSQGTLDRSEELQPSDNPQPTLFSYSYAARDLFRYAKTRGWQTVLGQIDPGPEEERIVAAEHQRYPQLTSRWQPVPAAYWESWREEVALADRILVNSEWSRQCLLKEGVADEKLKIVPLVYQVGLDRRARRDPPRGPECERNEEASGRR
jgi:hypothetical protein